MKAGRERAKDRVRKREGEREMGEGGRPHLNSINYMYNIYIFLCMCVWVCVCACVFVYICIYMPMNICMFL